MAGSFIYIAPLTLLSIVSSFLLAVSIIRFVFVKNIDTPWYIFLWIANRFTSPKRIVAHMFPYREEKIVFRKIRKKPENKTAL